MIDLAPYCQRRQRRGVPFLGESASIQGAMVSGRYAADLVAEDLGGPRREHTRKIPYNLCPDI